MQVVKYRIKLVGSGSAFPKQVVSNHDLAQKVNTSHDWIFDRTGIEFRCISQKNDPQRARTITFMNCGSMARGTTTI